MERLPSRRVLDADEAVALASGARFIAIDGLPVSGKSTLADRMIEALGAQILYLDDFVRPEAEWRGLIGPSFPFAYIRYGDFLDAVRTLVTKGACSFFPYDWAAGRTSGNARHLSAERPVVIEGVSSLHPDLAPLYDLRIWVESDASSVLAASLERGAGDWAEEWRDLFLPSVDLYLASRPQERADFIVKGRGYSEAA